MKKLFLFLTLLISGIGMTWAQFTWTNSSTAITTEAWASSANWTCASGTTFPTAGSGPMTTNSNAWAMVNFTGCSGSVADLEGWNPKMTLDATNLTVENMRKMQGDVKNFTLKNGSTLTITLGASNSGNDGGTVPVTFSGNGNTFNLKIARDKGGDATTVNYGTVTDATTDRFNVSSSASGTTHTYNNLQIVATITDSPDQGELKLHQVVLATISSDITLTTWSSTITANGYTQAEGVLTATAANIGKYSVVKSDDGNITLYWVTGAGQFSNTKTYTITNAGSTTIHLYYDGTNSYAKAGTDATDDDNHKWVIYQKNGKTYVYNVGAKKLLHGISGTGGHYNWPLVTTPASPITITQADGQTYYYLRDALCSGDQDYLHYNSGYTYGTTNWGTTEANSHWTIAESGTASADLQAEVLQAIEDGTVTIPATGKYYYLKGAVSGNYLNADGTTLTMKSGKDNATIFYLGSDYSLRANGTLNYLNNSAKNLSTTVYAGTIAIGTMGASAGISFTYNNNGYYMYDNSTATDRGTTYNSQNYQWYFEDIDPTVGSFQIVNGDNSNDQAGIKSIGFAVPATNLDGTAMDFASLDKISVFTKTGNSASSSYMVISTSTAIADKVAISTNNPTPAGSFADYTFSNVKLEAGRTYYMLFATDAEGTTQTNQRIAISSTSGSGQLVVNSNGEAQAGWVCYYKVNPVTYTLDDMFSTTYGEKWIRLSNCSNSNYAWYATSSKLGTATKALENTNQLFCFVGDNTKGFKIYSMELGSTKALKTTATTNGTAPSWADVSDASTWFVDTRHINASSQPGYGITTDDVTTDQDHQSLNMYGGNGGDAKFYSNASGNGGSRWTIERVFVLTINQTVPGVEGSYTWNGQTKAGSTVLFTSNQVVTNPAITCNAVPGYTSSLSSAAWYGVSNATITNTLSAAFFTTEADFTAQNENVHWIRINHVNESGYCPMATTPGNEIPIATADLTNEAQLWCFVGDNTNGFKIYNKAYTGYVIQAAYADPGNGTTTTLVATADAVDAQSTWVLGEDYLSAASKPGYTILLKGKTGFGLNKHTGYWRFYTASDAGSRWTLYEVGGELTINVNVAGTILPINSKVGAIAVTYNSQTTNTSLNLGSMTEAGALTTLKVRAPQGASITIADGSPKFAGYDFSGVTYNGETTTSLTINSVPVGGATATVTYTANEKQNLFYTYDHGRPYRIPAIAKAYNGDLIAVSDDRYCGQDIGYGRVDLVYKVSKDNGKTWGAETMLAQGDGDDASNTCGYGDAAICADRTSNKIMLMCVSAPKNGTCWTAAQRGVITWGTLQDDGSWKWETPVDIKNEIMALIPSDRINYFVGSGKISQSRVVKKGDYYRVYVAIWTWNGSSLCDYVVYSDELGAQGSWKLLGSKDESPASGGDEPKAEELPNGNVILSGRKASGRYYNIFTFATNEDGTTNYDSGTWGSAVASNEVSGGLSWGGNSTNGEIMVVNAKKSDNTIVPIVFQSAPAGSGRSNVTVWYKVLDSADKYSTPTTFSQNWTKGKEFSAYNSCYSTMTVQKDVRIAFYYEEAMSGAYYDMVYTPVDLADLAGLEDCTLVGGSIQKDEESSSEQDVVVTGTVTSAEEVASVVTEGESTVDMTGAEVAATIDNNFVETIAAKTDNPNTLVYVPATATVTEGTTNVVVKNEDNTLTCTKLVLSDSNDKIVSIPTAFTATNASYERTTDGTTPAVVTKSKYATICMPYAFSTEGIKVMAFNRYENGLLYFQEVEKPEANVPYLIREDDGTSESEVAIAAVGSNAKVATTATSPNSGAEFLGTYEPMTLYATQDGYDYFGWSAANGDFRRASAEGNAIYPFRAYFRMLTTGEARLAVHFDAATGITNIVETGANAEPIYNVNGERVDKITKGGVYIQGGRKIISK